jgi:AraC-type DNA-binding domain-containing proteins
MQKQSYSFDQKVFNRSEKRSSIKTILINEANRKMRDLIIQNLGSGYEVIWADDLIDVLNILRARKVHLLVLKDSVCYTQELLNSIQFRNNDGTKYTNIIMIVPPQRSSVLVDFYKAGVDTCLIEPVNHDVLEACIMNLMRKQSLQTRVEKKFRDQCIFIPSYNNLSTQEDLLRKASVYIESRLKETNIMSEEIATYLGISHSTLYRRIKVLTGMSIGGFIHNIRLKTAAKLLSYQQDKISDIAINVGFSDPKYFRRLFKNLYGVTPGEYRARNDI